MRGNRLFVLLVLAAVVATPSAGRAETATEKRLRMLEDALREAQQEIERLRDEVRQQRAVSEGTRSEIEASRAAREEQGKKIERNEKAEEVAVAAKKPPSPDTFRFFWKDGPRFETADGNFKLHLGGRIQNDWAIIDSSEALQDELDVDAFQSGTEFRRARIEIDGDVYKDFYFKFQLDFADAEVAFKDVYMGARNVPLVQNVRVGHFKEPFSLEEQTSSVNITFMERGLPHVFSPERNTGIAIRPNFFDDRMTYRLGAFRGDTADTGSGFGNQQSYDIATRATGLPWYADNGRQLVHLGLSYIHQFRHQEDLQFRERPESHLADRFVDTGDFRANAVDTINPELAVVYGPFSLQTEYMRAFVDGVGVGNPDFDGVYAYVSYFLTGEHRAYSKAEGAFDKVRPKSNFNFGREGGWGAWEVAARYSRLSLTSADVFGGNLGDTTLGLNWYLNPNIKIMANYIYADLAEAPGSANIFQSRFQIFW